jgi:hypothetical protein
MYKVAGKLGGSQQVIYSHLAGMNFAVDVYKVNSLLSFLLLSVIEKSENIANKNT